MQGLQRALAGFRGQSPVLEFGEIGYSHVKIVEEFRPDRRPCGRRRENRKTEQFVCLRLPRTRRYVNSLAKKDRT